MIDWTVDLLELARKLMRAALGLEKAKERKVRARDRRRRHVALERAATILDEVAQILFSAEPNLVRANALLEEFWRVLDDQAPSGPGGPTGGNPPPLTGPPSGGARHSALRIRAAHLQAMLVRISSIGRDHGTEAGTRLIKALVDVVLEEQEDASEFMAFVRSLPDDVAAVFLDVLPKPPVREVVVEPVDESRHRREGGFAGEA